MPNILVWVVLTLFLLITPKTTLAEWNGLSTAGPDYLNSTDGKNWTYEIGNDGTTYTGGKQVKLAFGAYWCGSSNAAGCAGDNPDYKGVSTLQKFTISTPLAGDSTAPATKTFTISSTDYPCGRIQADIVPDPNPAGDILGGHIYDTGKTCPPDQPSSLSASCSAGTGTFNWTSGIGADTDDLRIDYNPPSSWSNNCSLLNSNDYCFGPPASPGYVNNMASGTYDWWVDSCNLSGCKTKHGSEYLICPAAALSTSISVTPTSITKTTTWPQLDIKYNTNDSTATRISVCKGSPSDTTCSTDLGWTDIFTSLTKDGAPHTNNWTPPSSYTAGTYYFAVYPAGTPKLARSNNVDFSNPLLFDFSVSSPRNISLVKGATDAGRSITVTKTQGTAEPVTLSLNGSAGGATATFNPASCTPPNTSCNSTLTFNTSSATPGTYSNLKVRGTTAGGTTRDSTTFTLTITVPAPTVSLTASPTSIISGDPTTLTWNITNTATSCSVSNSGTPTITSGNWSTTLTGSDVTSGTHSKPITMTTTTNGAVKTFNITCTNSGVNSFPASASVTVNTSGSPCPTATEGYSCSTSSPGTNCSLKSAYTCPAGGSCYFCSPPPAPTISTLRITNSCIKPNHSGSDVDISWTNTGIDWVNISTDSAFGSYYHKNVTGFSTTAPNGFNLNPSNPPLALTLNPAPSIYYARTYNSTQNSHSQTASFHIDSCTTTASFDYSLSNNGGITLTQGSSGSNTITRTLSAGTSQLVTLSVLSGLPLGASASFTSNPSSPTSSSTLTITTSLTTPIGSYPNITVTGSPLAKTTTFTLTVKSPGGLCDGDGICEAGEITLTCPTDCPSNPGGTCPNNICEAGETTASCPIDCPGGGPICGNNKCEDIEPITCLPDCPGVPAPVRRSKPWIQIRGDVHSNTGIR